MLHFGLKSHAVHALGAKATKMRHRTIKGN